MRIQEIRKKASVLGVDAEGLTKPDLIRAIQRREGFTACYGSFRSGCPYTTCCFRSDCRKEPSAEAS